MTRPPSAFRNAAARTRRSAGLVWALAGTALGLWLPTGVAAWAAAPSADARRQPGAVAGDVDQISGRDFAGIRFPLAATGGRLSFRSAKAFAWVEEPGYAVGAAPGVGGAPGALTQKLLLSGDVRVQIGAYLFSAKRGVVWLQRIPAEDHDGKKVYQVFAYLDQVATAEADAAISMRADRLPVRGVVEIESGIELRADSLSPTRPLDPFLEEAEQSLAKSLRAQVQPGTTPEPAGPGDPLRPGSAEVVPADEIGAENAVRESASRAVGTTQQEIRDLMESLPLADAAAPIFAKSGLLTIAPGDWTLISGEQENAAEISGGLVVQYEDLARPEKSLQLTSERGVIFLKPGPLEQIGRLRREDVLGIYLEGDVVVVAEGGKYTLRGPRVFYDLTKGRSVILDAVFWTYDQQRRLPLYLRAKTIRQEAEKQFSAEKATLTNSAFLDPQFSIGATTMTITGVPRERQREPGSPRGASDTAYLVDADNVTLRTNNLPFFYVPRYRGFPEDVPLRDVRVENSSGSGSAFKTTWSIQGLLGLERTNRFGADLQADYYFDRGVGLGTKLTWQDVDSKGEIFAYGLPSDSGKDILRSGAKIDRDNETRDIFLGEYRLRIDEHWAVQLEGSYVSDESFVDAFFRPLAQERREFTNRVLARRLEDNTALTIEAKANFNDFLANDYLLQAPGYATQKLPELMYTRQADDLFPGLESGLVSYFSEYRVSRLKLSFDEPRSRERGYTNDFLAQRAFGINSAQSIADRLRAGGYSESDVNRFDTRHEFDLPLSAGPVNVTPFAVGRLTLYDDDFSRFSPDESENARAWGGIGSRFSTTIQRVDDTVDSRLFDLHRLRHIVEPNATVWHAGTNIDSVNLPVYDREVEQIAEGSTLRLGLDQTFQTQRGGPGRWHSVDVLKFDSSVVFSSGDSDQTSPVGRFVQFRPELSNPGNYLNNELIYQLSDTFAITGSSIYDMNVGQQSRSSAGFIIDHWPGFFTDAEIRNLHPERTTLLTAGAGYRLSSKYDIYGSAAFDLNDGGFQSTGGEVRRRFPGLVLGVGLSYDNINGETSFSFILQPEGVRGQNRGLSGIGGRGLER